MPVILDEIRKKVEITLPITKAKVWIYEYALAGDILGTFSVDITTGQPKNLDPVDIVVSIIADWDFFDKENNKLEVNKQNVNKLPIQDFAFLSKQVESVTNNSSIKDVKKNTASNSI